MGSPRLEVYLASEYFGENAERDKLNAVNGRFGEAEKKRTCSR